MKVVIIEDESLASERLKKMILSHDNGIEVVAQLESVEESVEWFKNNPHPELIFLDIHLEDDLSFAIFDKVKVTSSIIFTTAFDEYAIKAFKLKSIDYLLKPIVQEELDGALNKYRELNSGNSSDKDFHLLYDLIVKKNETYKERFSVRVGQKIKTFTTSDIAYFTSDSGFTSAHLYDGRSYYIDSSLDALAKEIDPAKFFRINRQMTVSIDAVKEVHIYSTNRLKLDLNPTFGDIVLVSIDKATKFKDWLEGQV
jgi:DNA-binding LytR/AlgR family response regulator